VDKDAGLTFEPWLAVARPRLVEPLFDEQALRRLHTVSRHLPEDCLSILEVRLGPVRGPVDLSLRLETPSQARRLAEGPLPVHLRSFLERWSDPAGDFASVPCVWLELDLDRDPRNLPVPVVCARLPQRVDLDWLLESLWPAMQGRPLPPAQRNLVRRCWEEIPPSASLLYAFSLLSRDGGAVRMEIFGLEPDQIDGYLRRIGLAEIPEVTAAVPVFAGVESLHLSFDIASEVLPRIGIEGSFPRRPEREPRWRGLFARLVDRGLCTPEKREAVFAWPGYDSFWTAAGRWPEEAGIRTRCVRGLSHVKVVCRPGWAPEAKVYLTLGPLDRSGAGAAASSPARLSALAT
jgi:hypothetical protein